MTGRFPEAAIFVSAEFGIISAACHKFAQKNRQMADEDVTGTGIFR
ncbi:hypothetical protein [Roseibium sp.]